MTTVQSAHVPGTFYVLASTAEDYDDHTNPPVIWSGEQPPPDWSPDEWLPATDEQVTAYEAYWDRWYAVHDPANA